MACRGILIDRLTILFDGQGNHAMAPSNETEEDHGPQHKMSWRFLIGMFSLPVIAIIVGILFILLTLASTVLFAVTLFGTLGTLIALVGLYFWSNRKPAKPKDDKDTK